MKKLTHIYYNYLAYWVLVLVFSLCLSFAFVFGVDNFFARFFFYISLGVIVDIVLEFVFSLVKTIKKRKMKKCNEKK